MNHDTIVFQTFSGGSNRIFYLHYHKTLLYSNEKIFNAEHNLNSSVNVDNIDFSKNFEAETRIILNYFIMKHTRNYMMKQ